MSSNSREALHPRLASGPAQWESFFAHLPAGTGSRQRFGPLWENARSVQALVAETLGQDVPAEGARTPTLGDSEQPGSWNSLQTVPSFELPEEGGEEGDEAIAVGLRAITGRAEPTLFAGTRGDMRDVFHVSPAQA